MIEATQTSGNYESSLDPHLRLTQVRFIKKKRLTQVRH